MEVTRITKEKWRGAVDAKCPCREAGTDGTSNHAVQSGQVYILPVIGEVVAPCLNHVDNYALFGWTLAYEKDFVGFLVPHPKTGRGHGVECDDCHDPIDSSHVPVFRINIYPYRQDCCKCGMALVDGANSSWPELFDGR